MTAQLTTSPIQELITRQRAFFKTGQTKEINFRRTQLQRLQQAILDHQDAIVAAVNADLGRPAYEAYFEMASLGEIKKASQNLKTWTKPHRVKTSIDQFPSSAWIQPEPLGVVLIIGPWNYPFSLLISPLVGAIAAGNCAILKPSEHAPQTSKVIADIIQASFPAEYIAVTEGGVETSQQLLAEKFDHIFFTGGTAIGKIIMAAAAKHLTPVTLELGGKSPCIVDAEVDLKTTAKRIVWGKFINTGQTCIAPDYLLVDQRIKQSLLELLKENIQAFYGTHPATSKDYGRIITPHHFARLAHLIDPAKVVIGGQTDPDQKYIAPTILTDVTWEDAVMQEEIFGPLLPVLTYDHLDQALEQINARPKPLALYFFSKDKTKQQQVLNTTSSGGVCINDTVMQVGIADLPFGGVGDSGMGNYHGQASFKTFSHYKSVLKKGLWLDLDWRYAPYTEKKLQQIKRIING